MDHASSTQDLKNAVKAHWEEEPCNTRYSSAPERSAYFRELTTLRYRYEPNILALAQFEAWAGKRVLEIGVGYGADFVSWVKAGAIATGVDLTEAALALTCEHLAVEDVPANRYELRPADAEALPFANGTFDLVYSYGVLHHTPDTPRTFRETFRVLKPGGELRAMIYHAPSWTGINLWLYHALLKLRPWQSLKDVMFRHLESPGTKAYTQAEGRVLLEQAGFERVESKLFLDPGDLLTIKLGPKYAGNPLVRTAMVVYPRWLVRMFGNGLGTTMHLTGTKPDR